jgi:antitoxin HicB
MSALEFQIIVEPVPPEYGAGFVASVAELPDCMACGKTSEEAIARVSNAIAAWKMRAAQAGREIPRPLAVLEKPQGAGCPTVTAFPTNMHHDLVNAATDCSKLPPTGASNPRR